VCICKKMRRRDNSINVVNATQLQAVRNFITRVIRVVYVREKENECTKMTISTTRCRKNKPTNDTLYGTTSVIVSSFITPLIHICRIDN